MKQHPNRKQHPLKSLTKFELHKLYLSEHKPSHHEKWNNFADKYPELARKFLLQSNFVRDGTLDSGDAYLHAAADLFTELKRLQTIEDLRHFNNLRTHAKSAIDGHRHYPKEGVTCNMCSE